MICSNCSQKLDPGEKFCSKCGTPAKKSVNIKKGISPIAASLITLGAVVLIAAVVLVVVFLRPGVKKTLEVNSSETTEVIVVMPATTEAVTDISVKAAAETTIAETNATETTVSEITFSTPEAAIEHFVNAIKNNDIESALEACAIEEVAEGYDFTGMANRIGMLMPLTSLAPSEYKMYADINKVEQTAKISGQIKCFAYSFFVTEGLDGRNVPITSDNQAVDFVSAVDPQKLSKLVLKRIDIPKKSLMFSELYIENSKKQTQHYGAEELTERVALYELNGELYIGGFHLLRYKNNWKIDWLGSNLAGTNVYGFVGKTTLAEFEEILQ